MHAEPDSRSVIFDIHDFKRAEEALRDSEERFRAVFHQTAAGMVQTDLDGRFLLVNDRYCEITGYSREELMARNFLEITHPDDLALSREKLRELFSEKSPAYEIEKRYIRKDGGVVWAHVTVSFVQDAAGNPQYIIGAVQDFTERKRYEQTLLESEARFRNLADTAPIYMAMADETGNAVYFNKPWLEWAGRGMDEMRGLGWLCTLHPEDAPKFERDFKHAFQNRIPINEQYRFRSADGEYRWMLAVGAPRITPDGRFVGYFGTYTDFHELKQAQEALLARSEQARRLADIAVRLNTAPDAASVIGIVTEEARNLIGAHMSVTGFTTDSNWGQAISTVSLSDKYARWRGYDTEPKGAGIYSLVCQTNKPMRMTQAELEAHPAWKGFSGEADRHPPIRGWLAAPLAGRDGRNIGLIQLSDKYEGEFTENDEWILVQLAQMASIAVENTRLVADLREVGNRKDRFLATLAHELRNPLAPLRNMLEIMKRTRIDNPVITQASAMMDRQLVHMVRLIDDLLDVSRISRGKLELRCEQVELATVVTTAADACRGLVDSAGHELKIALPPEPVYLYADPVRLTQIFDNLINNACKYTEPGGKILLTAGRRNGEVQVKIKDSGIGIPADKLGAIFEMFTQVDQSLERLQGGLGIGLTLVKQLVEIHGGTVAAYSDGPDSGAEFTVSLPVLREEKPKPEEMSPRADKESLISNRRRILVVDDNRDSAESLAMLLETVGNETRKAYDGLEAVTAAGQFRPDVVLLDIGLPKLNGYDACRRIRGQPWGENIMIVAVSGWGQEQDRHKSREAGFNHHLIKPVDFSALMKLLA